MSTSATGAQEDQFCSHFAQSCFPGTSEVSLTGLSYPRASLQLLGWLGIKQAVQKLSGMMVVYKQTLASSL